MEQVQKLMRAYKLLIELYEVDDFISVPRRHARIKNGEQLVQEVMKSWA